MTPPSHTLSQWDKEFVVKNREDVYDLLVVYQIYSTVVLQSYVYIQCIYIMCNTVYSQCMCLHVCVCVCVCRLLTTWILRGCLMFCARLWQT